MGALVAGIGLIFYPALPGILHFDDIGNLAGLSTITDSSSAWRWVQEGRAGPLGRPLALASFGVQYYQWPRPDAFLLWNIALHIINALLVFWLVVLVVRRIGEPKAQEVGVGLCVAFAWAALPFLNTSVLFIVQRMVLLSSTFILAGLVVYLKCRSTLRASWLRQFAALAVLAGFGVPAILTKESGALIVVYALVLELGLMAIARERRPTLAAIGLLLSSVLLLVGLTPYAFWDACVELQRGFTLSQRLGSQGILLPLYVKGIFLPRAAELNPFRFEYLLRDVPNLQWGIVVWLLLMVSPLIAWWKGWRLVGLALAWFFYGHVMESGWIALEPYFAHRNYLPAMGLVFGLIYGVFSIQQNPKLWRMILAAYIVLLGGLTWMNTSLWGDRALAAEMWANEEPRSVRAVLNLSYEVEQTQGLVAAQRYLDRFVEEQRDGVGLRLQGLVSACTLDPDTDHTQQLHAALRAISTLPYEGWATDQTDQLMKVVHKHPCKGVSADQVAEVAAAFLSQPAYQCNKPATHNMLALIGLVAMQHGDTEKAMDFYFRGLKEALSYTMAGYYFDLASQQGNQIAIESLQTLLKGAPTPREVTQVEWQQLLDRIDDRVRGFQSAETPESQNAAMNNIEKP